MDAALRVFARSGSHGATTRRIAEEAGVNEVTLFRHFGSKSTLLQDALRSWVDSARKASLPPVPSDPERELCLWCLHGLIELRRSQALVRTCLAELDEHPELAALLRESQLLAASPLTHYLEQLRAGGWTDPDLDVSAASALLLGAVFSDALTRDLIPELFHFSVDAAARHYTHLFLQAIGVRSRNESKHENDPR